MRHGFKLLFIKTLRIWILSLCFFSVCCKGPIYTTQHFSYPPGSKPHENDWEYTMMIITFSKRAPITKKSKKVVKIKIYDKNKTIFLDEDFNFSCASVSADVSWLEFEKIKVELFEEGNKFSKDQYNQDLLKSGPKRLLELTYRYDHEDKKFKKTN